MSFLRFIPTACQHCRVLFDSLLTPEIEAREREGVAHVVTCTKCGRACRLGKRTITANEPPPEPPPKRIA